jgi:hypothetical protein
MLIDSSGVHTQEGLVPIKNISNSMKTGKKQKSFLDMSSQGQERLFHEKAGDEKTRDTVPFDLVQCFTVSLL